MGYLLLGMLGLRRGLFLEEHLRIADVDAEYAEMGRAGVGEQTGQGGTLVEHPVLDQGIRTLCGDPGNADPVSGAVLEGNDLDLFVFLELAVDALDVAGGDIQVLAILHDGAEGPSGGSAAVDGENEEDAAFLDKFVCLAHM